MTDINHRRNGRKYSSDQVHSNSLYPVEKGMDEGYMWDGKWPRPAGRRWIKRLVSRYRRRVGKRVSREHHEGTD